MQRTSDYQNELGDFIERCVPERCGDRELPVLSVTKEYAMVHQSERFEATVVSRDKSNYIVAPRGYLVQGIHIDESNFGIQNLVDEGIVSPAYKLWRFKNQDCIPELIEYYLRSEMAIKYFKRHFLGSTVPRRQVIKKDDFLSMPLNLPEKRIQERYFAFFQQADKSKFSDFKSRFFSQFADLPFDHKWKDVLTIINGKAYGEDYKVSGTYPICGSGGIMGYGEKKMCDRDSIILGRKGNIDKPIYMSEDYWIVDTAFCLSPNTELIHPVYLYYWCKQFDFQKLNKQAVLPSLTRSDLEQIDIQVPEMAEQLAFAEIVHQVDKSKYLN